MVTYDVYLMSYEGGVWVERPLWLSGTTSENIAISKARMNIKASEVSKFEFTIAPNHKLYNRIVEAPEGAGTYLRYIVLKKNNKVYFKGKISSVKSDLRGVKTVESKGNLEFLRDSIYSRYLFKYVPVPGYTLGTARRWKPEHTPRQMLQDVLAMHNAQTGQNVTIGRMTVTENPYGVMVKNTSSDSTGSQQEGLYITRDQSAMVNTLDWFQNELVGKTEGVVVCRFANTKPYDMILDVLAPTLPKASASDGKLVQAFRVGRNILDRTIVNDSSNLFTVLLPIGQANANIGKTMDFSKILSTIQKTIDQEEPTEEDEEGFYTQQGIEEDQLLDSDDFISVTNVLGDDAVNEPVADPSSTKYYSVIKNPPGHTGGEYLVVYKDTLQAEEHVWVLDGDPVWINPADQDDLPVGIAKHETVGYPDQIVVANGITLKFVPPFIEWVEGIQQYGRIVQEHSWSSASRSNLAQYAPAYFKKSIYEMEQVTLTATDLRLTDDQYESPQVGYQYHIISDGYDRWLPCLETAENILDPTDIKFTFSRTSTPLTTHINDIIRTAKHNPASTNLRRVGMVNGEDTDTVLFPIHKVGENASNAVFSNTATRIPSAGTYSTTIDAANGYVFRRAPVVKMDGVAQQVTQTATGYSVTIQNVTAAVLISMSLAVLHLVEIDVTHCTVSPRETYIVDGDSYQFTIQTESGYRFDIVSVICDETPYYPISSQETSREYKIDSVTGPVYIYVSTMPTT